MAERLHTNPEPALSAAVHQEAARAAPGVSVLDIWTYVPLLAAVLSGIRAGATEIPLIKVAG